MTIEANLIDPRVRELRTRCLIIEHECQPELWKCLSSFYSIKELFAKEHPLLLSKAFGTAATVTLQQSETLTQCID